VEDVLECNRELLDTLARDVAGDVDEASELTGAVVVEPGARIVRSLIEGPAIIGADSVVVDSHIGPHTSIGRECAISGARIDYSITLDGAHVAGAKGLHGSVIGRSATVTTADHPSGRHSLIVGDHARIEVAA